MKMKSGLMTSESGGKVDDEVASDEEVAGEDTSDPAGPKEVA